MLNKSQQDTQTTNCGKNHKSTTRVYFCFYSTSSYMMSQSGTIVYLAPEMIQDLPYTHKVDIWALGITLYQLSVLEHPVIILGSSIQH